MDHIKLPYSKSIGARYLVASYFAGALASCPHFDDSDDLRVIQKALVDLSKSGQTTAGTPLTIDIHASGTAFRFMAAVIASTPGAECVLTGTPRVCSRPMGPMIDVLLKAGARIQPLGENGSGPFRISGIRPEGGEYEIRGDVSSQFISALMLAGATWENGLRLNFTTPLVSRPYAEMTAEVMRRFGIDVTFVDTFVDVRPGVYTFPEDFKVEADWSAAGFFYEAVCGRMRFRPLYIDGLLPPGESLQGDAATAHIYRRLGCASEFSPEGVKTERIYEIPDELNADLTDNPDLVPALAVTCVLMTCRFNFTGVRNLRVKECDRLAALKNEFEKFGIYLDVGDDFIAWHGGITSIDGIPIVETYDDHRIAMAFAMMGYRWRKVGIKNPDVVAKSFEDFWTQAEKAGLTCQRDGDVMYVERYREDEWL